jgi:ubiquinone/menaquinone biosynthesis C-methylase UbiE
MEQPEPDVGQPGLMREGYGLRGTELQRMMVTRTAARQASFLLPHLRVGMDLLDCGSGPGSITADLARFVAPGQVVGIDIGEEEVERAHAYADENGITNVAFRVGDVYALPFADSTFDAVFSNALLDHLRAPQEAIAEMYRVLKPGGVLGVRTADRDGYLMTPHDPIIEAWALRGEQEKLAQGVHVRIGKKLRSFMRQAGFVDVEASASYDCYGTADRVRALGEAMAKRADKAAQAGDQEAAQFAAAWRRWGQSPDAFAAQSLCEAVGWRPAEISQEIGDWRLEIVWSF